MPAAKPMVSYIVRRYASLQHVVNREGMIEHNRASFFHCPFFFILRLGLCCEKSGRNIYLGSGTWKSSFPGKITVRGHRCCGKKKEVDNVLLLLMMTNDDAEERRNKKSWLGRLLFRCWWPLPIRNVGTYAIDCYNDQTLVGSPFDCELRAIDIAYTNDEKMLQGTDCSFYSKVCSLLDDARHRIQWPKSVAYCAIPVI